MGKKGKNRYPLRQGKTYGKMMNIKNSLGRNNVDHKGHRERLRQRFEQNGLNGFAEHEVLELLLTYAIPRVDVNPLAHRLVDRFGSLAGVLEASVDELRQVQGMGERSAALIALMLPLLKRYRQEGKRPRRRILTYSSLAEYCASLFIGCREENFYLLCFDAKMQLTKEALLSVGNADEVPVSPRHVVREAMRANAVSVAVTHNHPSGDPTPSQEDVRLTQGIREALQVMEIRLLDHMVVGREEVFSLVRNGLIGVQGRAEEYAAAENGAWKRQTGVGKDRCREEDDFLC